MGIFQNSNLSVGTLTTRAGIAASPLDYAGLVIWLDSYDPNTITGSANTVTTWSDKSGGGRHFTQATAAARPTYQPASFNGLPSINFNGSSNFLTYSGGVSYNRFTVFGVLNVQNNATMQTQDIFSKTYFYALGTSDFPFRGISAGSTVTSLSVGIDAGGDYTTDRLATSSAAPNTNYIFTSYHDQTNLITTLNGVTGQTTPSTIALSSTAAPYAIGRAGLNNGGGTEASYYKGNMAELIMYNVALTAAQQANIRSYLSTKWKIPIS